MEQLDIEISWYWEPGRMTAGAGSILGGHIPQDIIRILRHHSNFSCEPGSELHVQATRLANLLGQDLPDPEPLELGTEAPIAGEIVTLLEMRCSPKLIRLTYRVQYENGFELQLLQRFDTEKLTALQGDLLHELDRKVYGRAKNLLFEIIGRDKIDVDKWKAEKIKVFISYRSHHGEVAMRLFDSLGEFQDRTVFLPMIDKVDMQSGSWLDQIMKMINAAEVFVPVLTTDYLDGPIAKPELELALRTHFRDSGNGPRIVPVLLEGEFKDYADHFLGSFHIVDGRERSWDEFVGEVAGLALGISRNPYR